MKNKINRPSTKFAKEYFKDQKIKCAEIGVFVGQNALNIYENLNIETLFLIDSWNDYHKYDCLIITGKEKYKETLKKFKNKPNVKIISKYSAEAVKDFKDESLDFIYIDACHRHDEIKQDIELWYPKIKKGGILAGHDFSIDFVGAIIAVLEFVMMNNLQDKFIVKIPDWIIIK